ncbi:MAG: chorismate-binding protein [Caldilineaceae bacterium]
MRAVGYIANDGNMDTCIAIRTMVMRGKPATSKEAGGGIVADSDPTAEYHGHSTRPRRWRWRWRRRNRRCREI